MCNSNEGRGRRNKLRQAQLIFRVVSAAVFIATGTAFSADTNLSDCNLASLAAALQGGGTVTLSSTNSCTFFLTNTITIQTNVTVVAPSSTVRFQGNDSLPVFRIGSNVTDFRLSGVTVSDGKSMNGGGMFIESGATATLSNCVFTANNAAGTNGASGADGADHSTVGGNGGNGTSGSGGFGGAIYNEGTLSAYYCRFLTNTAQGGNGGTGGNGGSGSYQGGDGGNGGTGASGLGGAIFNLGALYLRDCTFERNAALGGFGGSGGVAGGGVFLGLVGNGKAGGEGSGGAIYSTNSTGTASVLDCTFSFNRSQSGDSAAAGNDSNGNGNDGARGKDSFGGALFNSEQMIAVTNSTFFENTAQGGNGGNGGPGNYNGGNGGNGGNGTGGSFFNSTSGSNWVVHCTFSQGSARGGTNGVGGNAAFPGSNGSNGANRGGNVANASGGSFNLLYSLIASNVSGGNGYGSFTDRGTNLTTDASMTLTNGSLTKTNARIGSLAENGGLTKTIALLSGSPAIDAIPETNCIIAFDQRGFHRPYGNGCDIGAVERVPTFSIQGQVTENNVGLSNITLTINDQTAITGTNGFYFISNLQTNSYTITPQPAGFFSPPNQVVTVPPDATNINFGAHDAIARTNGQIRISFLALPNRTYRIQAATNLVSTNFLDGTNLISSNLTIWITIATNTSSSNGDVQFIETSVTNFQQRFFRTVRP